MKKYFLLLFSLILLSPLCAQKKISTKNIDWEFFLSQHDLIWDTIKNDYYSGAILGNGLLGTNIYAASGENSYRWDIGRSDVTENRGKGHVLYDEARLPIGFFTLTTDKKIISEKMRLSLWDATAQGELKTDSGSISFKTFVDANRNVIVIETKKEGVGAGYTWKWNPEYAISPRALFAKTHSGMPNDYMVNPNPPVEEKQKDSINYSIQVLYSGWTYVTAWVTEQSGDTEQMLVTVSYKNNSDLAVEDATKTLRDYMMQGVNSAETLHKDWWHNYYPASFATFPDAMQDSFYWIQQYKFAGMTRSDKNIIDLMGPWPDKTPWPAIWWNLNIQLTYSPLFTANRSELSKPLWNAFDKHMESLINNVPVEEWRKDAACIGRSSSYNLVRALNPEEAEKNLYETGNLTWILFYYWQYCTYNADENELLTKFYPLLKRSIAYYGHILYKDENGKYHLPLTASPEYKPAADCNYDLALLRWGLNTLIDISQKHKPDEPLIGYWSAVLENLIDYPTDPEQGYMIGRDVKLESSHRHYSHLLMIYPLHLINWDQEENRDLILRSLNHWIGMEGALQGYSYTGSSSIYSMMGDGEKAVKQLSELLKRYIKPNTLYKEAGPVVETPLSAATALQELYLQTWNGLIRVFPAVPATWIDASFVDFRTEGGFLISALRRNASTAVIQIESTKGGLCRIKTGMNPDQSVISVINKKKKIKYRVTDKQAGIYEINATKGDIIQITDKSLKSIPSINIKHNEADTNYFGVRQK